MSAKQRRAPRRPEYVLRYSVPAQHAVVTEHRSQDWASFHVILRKLILEGQQVLVRAEK